MPDCKKIKKPKRQVCIGDMRDRITLQNRTIAPPVFGDPDFSLDFSDSAEVFAMISTSAATNRGKIFFDGVSTETEATHEIIIRFDSTVTAETWIEFGDRRFDILNVDNMDERNQFLRLTCAERGLTAKAASEA